MGATATETAREITALRVESERLLDALERRAQEVQAAPKRLLANPIVGVAIGAVAVFGVLVFILRRIHEAREARRPSARLRRGAEQLRATAGARARGVGRALRGESFEERESQAEQEGLGHKLLGTVAATATLALVDQFTRWLSERRGSSTV